MSTKLFVGGLSFTTTNDALRRAFDGFGQVSTAEVIMDRETGRSRGFGFVSFQSSTEAQAAIDGMNGQSLDGRMLRVSEAQGRDGGHRR